MNALELARVLTPFPGSLIPADAAEAVKDGRRYVLQRYDLSALRQDSPSHRCHLPRRDLSLPMPQAFERCAHSRPTAAVDLGRQSSGLFAMISTDRGAAARIDSTRPRDRLNNGSRPTIKLTAPLTRFRTGHDR